MHTNKEKEEVDSEIAELDKFLFENQTEKFIDT